MFDYTGQRFIAKRDVTRNIRCIHSRMSNGSNLKKKKLKSIDPVGGV